MTKRLDGKKGCIYLHENEIQVVIDNKDRSQKTVFAPYEDLDKWIKKLEITQTVDGKIKMGSWW